MSILQVLLAVQVLSMCFHGASSFAILAVVARPGSRRQSSLSVTVVLSATNTTTGGGGRASSSSSSLKPAAVPLMDAGKALARCGELVIDVTASTDLDLYGGGLSAAGAQIRNAGDCLAQAAASCRFKTGTELVTDECREAATCLAQAATKLQLAVEEATQDNDERLGQCIEPMIAPVQGCSTALEAAGAALMQRQSVDTVGQCLVLAAASLQELSQLLPALLLNNNNNDTTTTNNNAETAAQRCRYAAEQMKLAGDLRPIDANKEPKSASSGKSWLKGSGKGAS